MNNIERLVSTVLILAIFIMGAYYIPLSFIKNSAESYACQSIGFDKYIPQGNICIGNGTYAVVDMSCDYGFYKVNCTATPLIQTNNQKEVKQ